MTPLNALYDAKTTQLHSSRTPILEMLCENDNSNIRGGSRYGKVFIGCNNTFPHS